MMNKITVTQQEPTFQPITLTIDSKVTLASILGAFIAYGTANTFAENSLKAVNLGDFYNGNVRKSARELAMAISEGAASANIDLDGLDDLVAAYLSSHKFKKSRASAPGAAVAGTDEAQTSRYWSTEFETNPNYVAPRVR